MITICPRCGEADMVHDVRDLPHTYRDDVAVLPNVEADYCPNCDEAIFSMGVSARVSAFMLAHHKAVNRKVVDPEFIIRVRKKLKLDQREAGLLFGDGINSFNRYEQSKSLPPRSLIQLLQVLDRYPELQPELQA